MSMNREGGRYIGFADVLDAEVSFIHCIIIYYLIPTKRTPLLLRQSTPTNSNTSREHRTPHTMHILHHRKSSTPVFSTPEIQTDASPSKSTNKTVSSSTETYLSPEAQHLQPPPPYSVALPRQSSDPSLSKKPSTSSLSQRPSTPGHESDDKDHKECDGHLEEGSQGDEKAKEKKGKGKKRYVTSVD